MDKELILKALLAAGLSEDLLDQIKATTDEELTTEIAALKEKAVPKPNLSELLKDEAFKKELSTHVEGLIQSETDKRIRQALETYKKTIQGTVTGEEALKTELGELKTLVTGLTEKITGEQTKQKQATIKVLSTKAIEEAGLPDTWVDRVIVESEDQIAPVIETLKKEHTDIEQGVIDKAIKNSPIPGLALGESGNITTNNIDNFVKTLESQTKQTNTVQLEPET